MNSSCLSTTNSKNGENRNGGKRTEQPVQNRPLKRCKNNEVNRNSCILYQRSQSIACILMISSNLFFAGCGTRTCCAHPTHHLTRRAACKPRGRAATCCIQFDDCHFCKQRRCRICAYKSRTCTNVIRNFHSHRALRSVARLNPLSSSVIRGCNFIFQPRVALPARKQHES